MPKNLGKGLDHPKTSPQNDSSMETATQTSEAPRILAMSGVASVSPVPAVLVPSLIIGELLLVTSARREDQTH